jgi:sporulation protein YlmC with PRC-barrel domain
MRKRNIVDLQQDLVGMTVVDIETSRKYGYPTDVIINPANGTILALLIQSPAGQESALGSDDFLIHEKAKVIVAFSEPVIDKASFQALMNGGVSAKSELLNSDVVTESGKGLGRITKILIQTEPMQPIYLVTKSAWRRLIGGGFYLPGIVAHAYSRVGARLIVPPNTKKRLAYRSLLDSFGAWKRKPTALP